MTQSTARLVVDAHAVTGEGPVWCDRDQVLWWCDIDGNKLHRFDPKAGIDREWDLGEPVACLSLHEAGGLVLALKSGFARFDPATGAVERLATPEADEPANRFNDGATDTRGRFWAGTMRMHKFGIQPTGAVYRLDPDGTCTRMMDGFWTINGMAFSPDGTKFYFSDSTAKVRTIWVADYDPDSGTMGERRVFFDTKDLAGRPDGGAVDANGCYWMAGITGGELVRFTPAGAIDRIVPMPVKRVTKLAFGGPGLTTGYVTSLGGHNWQDAGDAPESGALFEVPLGVKGLTANRYGG
jgi:sugar lactone lactonase YvrE